MTTPSAKRALQFGSGTPAKRQRMTTRSMSRRVYGIKPEMKDFSVTVSHSAATASDHLLSAINNGSAEYERIGAKVKFWNIECCFVSPESFRLDLYIPNDPTTTSTHTYSTAMDSESYTKLGTYYFNNNVSGKYEGQYFFHKLPLGVVSKWSGTAGTTVVKNAIQARITTHSSTTVTGYFRLWYTDV